ncbi:MAG: hypothetical protein ACREH8_04690 [Opitutaceae bacterium]
MNRTLPFPAADPTRGIDAEKSSVADGTYRVLATLECGARSYRVFADLIASGGNAQLRIFRFELPGQNEWFAERKINIPISRPEIAPLPHKISGAEFVLCTPVRLDEAQGAAFFGEGGLPSA